MATGVPTSLTEAKLIQLGRDLREVRLALRDPEPGRKRRWLQGPNYTDLILDYADGQLERMELTVASLWVMAMDGQVFTGHTDELDHSQGHPVARLVTRDEVMSHPVLAAARTVLTNLTDQALAATLIPLLTES